MPAVIPVLGYTLLGLSLASLIGLLVGWNNPERVLPKFMRPSRTVARLVYGVLVAWLIGGAIVFLFIGAVTS